MAKGKSRAVVKAQRVAEQARKRYNNLKKRYNAPPYKKVAFNVGGGFLNGVVRAQIPEEYKEIGGVPTDTLAGVLVTGYGLFNKGAMAESAIELGTGMLAASASRFSESQFSK
jgi:hypothetical protein